MTRARRDGMESAVSDIVLLGDRTEIETAEAVLTEMHECGSGSVKPLVRALRTSLRKELQIETLDTVVDYMRFSPTNLED